MKLFVPENLSISGARAFISLEHPNEMKLYEEKREAAKRVDSAADYLGGTFWNYVYDKDRYLIWQNMTLASITRLQP